MSIDPIWWNTPFNDELNLISQFYNTYDKKTIEVEIVLLDSTKAEEYVNKNITVCGIKKDEVLTSLQKHQIVTTINKKISPPHNRLPGITMYRVKINWKNLENYACQLHDTEGRLPSPLRTQTRKIEKLILNEGQKKKSLRFTVTEGILGKYTGESIGPNQQWEDESQLFDHKESKIYYYNFTVALKKLEKEGFLKILDIDFDFTERPKNLTGFDKDYAFFYPAEHCHVLIEIVEKNKTINSKVAKQDTNKLNKADPFQKENFKISFKKTFYDSKTATLTLNGIKIQIPPNTNQDYLCQIIFSNQKSMKKKWEWDEIEESEKWGNKSESDDKEPWRKTYNAAGGVNIKITIDMGIKDFFLTKPCKIVQINPKFLL